MNEPQTSDAVSVAELQALALEIYGRYDINKSLVWFFEEAGELVAAVRKGRSHENLSEELGDVMAWVLCLSNILDVDLKVALHNSMSKEAKRQIASYGSLKYARDSDEVLKALRQCVYLAPTRPEGCGPRIAGRGDADVERHHEDL